MIQLNPAYPTPEHEQVAAAIVDFLANQPETEAVLLVNSCARGKASRDSCLDIAVLVAPAVNLASELNRLETQWEQFYETMPIFATLRGVGKYAHVHLDFFDGRFAPQPRNEAAGPDDFEVWVGNFMAYSVPLWQRGDYLAQLKSTWLPYYDETLRRERLKMVRWYCLNNLGHIPLYVQRGLYFQAFDRLYNALGEFLQALFIARRTYPIAYNKWIHEQIVDILGLPELYAQLPRLLEIKQFESQEIAHKGAILEQLLDQYAPEIK
jgi:hypothetical protein